MRVWFETSAALRALRLIVADCVRMTAYPMAALVGLTRHPQAFEMVIGVTLIAAAAGFAIWVLMVTWFAIRAGLHVTILSLYRGAITIFRSVRRADCARRL